MSSTKLEVIATMPLTSRAMPALGMALRTRKERIMQRWAQEVAEILPAADELTLQQVLDSLPDVLDRLITAFESTCSAHTQALATVSRKHGESRFHQSYDVEELIIEYRFLRQIVKDELTNAIGAELAPAQVSAIDVGIDVMLQQGVVSFVEYQREQIEAASVAERRFLSFMSHDLRNHLNHISLVLDYHISRMRDESGHEEDIAEFEEIKQSIGRTVGGMERLLQVERLRRDTFFPRRERTELSKLARGMLTGFERQAKDKGLALRCDVPPELVVATDPELITLVLQNLIGNAVKFCQHGEIRVSAEQTAEDGWSLAVSDQGPGIAVEDQSRIFDAFTRGQTHGEGGVGLGLTIAAQSAKRMGGKLSVESKPGIGSTFRLNLPRMAA